MPKKFPKRINWCCADCNKDTRKDAKDFYEVHNEVWVSVAPKHVMLCITCLETQLGRRLTKEDFPDYPINRDNYYVVQLTKKFDEHSLQLFISGVKLRYRKVKEIIRSRMSIEEKQQQLEKIGFHSAKEISQETQH